MILDETTAVAAVQAAAAIGARSERTLTYMANAICPGTHHLPNKERDDPYATMAYSVVAALDPSAPAPLGPFQTGEKLGDGICLLDWPATPLAKLKVGDPVTIA